MALRFALWPERRAEYCASMDLYKTTLQISIVQFAVGFTRKIIHQLNKLCLPFNVFRNAIATEPINVGFPARHQPDFRFASCAGGRTSLLQSTVGLVPLREESMMSSALCTANLS